MEVLSCQLFEVIIQKESIIGDGSNVRRFAQLMDTHETLDGTWDGWMLWLRFLDSNWNVSFPRPAKQGGNPSLPNICKSHLQYNKSPASQVKEFANSIEDIADVQKREIR